MPAGDGQLFADWMKTPLGAMIAVADQTHLHLLEFHDRTVLAEEMRRIERKTGMAVKDGRTPVTDQILSELRAYFAGESAEFRTPLSPTGSDFEKKVWAELLAVPPGETCSYGDIARRMASMEAVRAVARANGANPIAIVIPCHRCIGSDGSLTGYGGGLWRKQWLLRHEGRMRPVGLFA